jgi:hypothetical protein
MGMKRYKKLVAVTGKYTDKDGQEKSQFTNCGTLLQKDDGSFVIKLDSLPLGEFNGWISCFDFDEERKQGYAKGTAQAREAMATEAPPDDDFANDRIPF